MPGSRGPTSRAVVQSAGYGYRLKSSILKKEFALGGKLQVEVEAQDHVLARPRLAPE